MVLHFDILIFSKCFKRLAAGDAGPRGGIPGHELLRRAARLHHVAAGSARSLARERREPPPRAGSPGTSEFEETFSRERAL